MTSELVERLRESLLDSDFDQYTYSIKRANLRALLNEIERLTARVTALEAFRDHLTSQLAEARQAERAAVSEVNACKDALAQTAEFICRKCGRRQDGPSDNEARF